MPDKSKIQNLEEKIINTEKRLIEAEKKLVKKSQQNLRRIPLLVPILGSFGLVSMFYGFEKLLDQSWLVENPILLILVGLGLMVLTGVAAQKL